MLLNHYTGTVECEALTFADMVTQHVLPSLQAASLPEEVAKCAAAAKKVADGAHALHAAPDSAAKASAARVLRLETMIEARKVVDNAEGLCPEKHWTLATYKDLLFLCVTQAAASGSLWPRSAPSARLRVLTRHPFAGTRRTTAGAEAALLLSR